MVTCSQLISVAVFISILQGILVGLFCVYLEPERGLCSSAVFVAWCDYFFFIDKKKKWFRMRRTNNSIMASLDSSTVDPAIVNPLSSSSSSSRDPPPSADPTGTDGRQLGELLAQTVSKVVSDSMASLLTAMQRQHAPSSSSTNATTPVSALCATHPSRWRDLAHYKLPIIQTAKKIPRSGLAELRFCFSQGCSSARFEGLVENERRPVQLSHKSAIFICHPVLAQLF